MEFLTIMNVEDTLKYKSKILENAEIYYGILLNPIEEMISLDFEKEKLYLAYLDTKYYPFTANMDERGIHCALIYGKDKNGYIVNDNYYGETGYIYDIELYSKAVKKVFYVECKRGYNNGTKNDLELYTKSISYRMDESIRKSYTYILNNKIKQYNSEILLEKIGRISSIVKQNAFMATVWESYNYSIALCRELLELVADEIRKIFYALLKEQLKYNIIPKDILYKKLQRIYTIAICEREIKEEICKILKGERAKMEELGHQIKRYLEVEQFDENTSVYINHDKLSILYLVNYLEIENSPIELEYEDFRECDTYLDFMAIVYRKWFLKDLYLK